MDAERGTDDRKFAVRVSVFVQRPSFIVHRLNVMRR
jgi:hypothetical protein